MREQERRRRESYNNKARDTVVVNTIGTDTNSPFICSGFRTLSLDYE